MIVKHHQPCGAATSPDLRNAYERALASDELSAYGGVVALNRPLDEATSRRIAERFFECVAAPDFDAGAEAAFESKKNLRVLRMVASQLAASDPWRLRACGPWWLAQREGDEPEPEWRPATHRAPTPDELLALRFAWEVVGAARSNAIAIASGTQLVGLGAGQTSRVDAVDVALLKARRAGHTLRGAVLASDAFFPFADGVEHAAAAGIAAIVQPGGSMRDGEVTEACDRHGIAMVLTGRRMFRH